MADMGNGRGFHIRAKGVKCGPHGLCPRAREKGFSGHHPPEADGAAGVLGRLGGQGEQEGVPREPDGVHPGMTPEQIAARMEVPLKFVTGCLR